MTKIWKYNVSKDLKIRFFIATNESILVYGCESWALSKAQEKSLDVTYTRMLQKALNIHWSSNIPNQQLYGELPAAGNKIASRRLQLAGHCYRHPELSTQNYYLWEPTYGHRGRGRPKTTYINTLMRDTGAFEASEIAALIADKRLWKDVVVARLRATKWVREWVKVAIFLFYISVEKTSAKSSQACGKRKKALNSWKTAISKYIQLVFCCVIEKLLIFSICEIQSGVIWSSVVKGARNSFWWAM